ncbi:MAG: PqqD family protein [Synechococcales cyanobacterium RM1_1_8]|nr:PqqD family protein [Synechococcales cyanobacterium RM1_1_8]
MTATTIPHSPHPESLAEPSPTRSPVYFVAAPDQVFSELGNEAVIMNLVSGTYFGLNEVGSLIWQRLQQPATLDDLCEAVEAEYDVNREVCQPDIEALLKQFQDAQLIELIDEAKRDEPNP